MVDYAVLGILISVVVEAVKRYFGTSTLVTYLVLGGVSLVGGVVYTLLAPTAYWPLVMKALIVSQAIYSLFLKNLPPLTSSTPAA